jgi:carboxyl-terminal processing protease
VPGPVPESAAPVKLGRRAWMRRIAASLAGLALASSVRGQEPALAPEFQLFLNALDAIIRHCVYKPSRRDVMVGALRGLSRQLGPEFSEYFPKEIPAEADEVTPVFIGTLRKIAASEKARAAKFNLQYLVERSIDGYCRTLDAYSEYADEATALRAIEAQKPDYVGIGISFKRTPQGFFCTPFPDGAAALAGVIGGDELLEIDKANVRAMTLLEISARLSGAVETKVALKVKHNDGMSETLTVMRQLVNSTPLTVDESSGVVRIGFRRINDRAREDLRTLLQSLGQGRALVLDFRGCPGGDFTAAVHIAELFLPEKTLIARIETVEGSEKKYSFNRAPYRPRSLRLLQDEFTASGAEVIIAALLNHPGIKVESRGEKTFGKGVTSQQIVIPGGGVLKITDSRVYGPHDEFWESEGLPPSSDAKPDDP